MTAPHDRRWWWLMAAAAVCTVLYFASSLGGVDIAVVGATRAKTLARSGLAVWAVIPAMLVMAGLAYAAVLLSVQFAARAGGPMGRLVGCGRSQRVPLAVGVHLAVLFVGVPVLTVIGDALGASGSTTVHLAHRSAEYQALIAWLAVLIAPWMEETSMRGFLLEGLWRRFGFWPAAVLSALVWSALHGVSGVLLPFVALGVSFAWVRRTTGSTRTGIALHGAQNTLATLVGGAGVLAAPPAIVLAASLWVLRPGADDPLSTGARAAVARAARAGRSVAGLGARLPAPPVLLWTLLGVWVAGVNVLAARDVWSGDTHSHLLRLSVLMGAVVAGPAILWLQATNRREWGASAYTVAAGITGAAIVVIGRLGDWTTIVPAGYVLEGMGTLGLALVLVTPRARWAAFAAGFCRAALLAPLPYLATSTHRFLIQEWLVECVSVIALVTLGFALRRERDVRAATV